MKRMRFGSSLTLNHYYNKTTQHNRFTQYEIMNLKKNDELCLKS